MTAHRPPSATPPPDPLDVLADRVEHIWFTRLDGNTDAVLLDHFELDHELGRGSRAVVFAGFDRLLEREVAVKVFDPSAAWSGAGSGAAEHEATLLAQLHHPNVVAVHRVGQAEGFTYLVLDLVDGWPMSRCMRAKIGWRELVLLFIQAGEGLAAAHQAGVIHGDLKPGNILVGRDGRVQLVDFGFGRLGDHEPGSASLGTRDYAAPERWLGARAEPAADQFSFCVALWEAMFGARPWSVGVAALLDVEANKGEGKEGVPEELERVLRRGLSARAGGRFASMQELLRALDGVLLGRKRPTGWSGVLDR